MHVALHVVLRDKTNWYSFWVNLGQSEHIGDITAVTGSFSFKTFLEKVVSYFQILNIELTIVKLQVVRLLIFQNILRVRVKRINRVAFLLKSFNDLKFN